MLLLFRDKLALLVLENIIYNISMFVRAMINDDTTQDEIEHELFPCDGFIPNHHSFIIKKKT